MKTCDVCGNAYHNTFEVVQGDRRGTFDAFECAIHAMAPKCTHCECRIIGHGVEAGGRMFCCEHCASHTGASG